MGVISLFDVDPINPQLAPVRPRVEGDQTDGPVLLDDFIAELRDRGERFHVGIFGPPGSGKTTALSHLAVGNSDLRIPVLDQGNPTTIASLMECGSLVYAMYGESPKEAGLRLRLCPWTTDEFIEYLLAVHPEQIKSVMGRVQTCEDVRLMEGNPRVARIVLDQMAADESITSVRDALGRELRQMFPDSHEYKRATLFAGLSFCDNTKPDGFVELFDEWRLAAESKRLLHHRAAWLILAAEGLNSLLAQGDNCWFLVESFPRDLVEQVAAALRGNEEVIARLRRLSSIPECGYPPMAVSLLHAAGTEWRPAVNQSTSLVGAYLSEINWPEVDLQRANLDKANFCQANLAGSNLTNARAVNAVFHKTQMNSVVASGIVAPGAEFCQANLVGFYAPNANLHSANFEGADLSNAIFGHAYFMHTNLRRAKLQGVSFFATDLSGSDVTDAEFIQVDFTQARLGSVDLRSCEIEQCVFSATFLLGADFTGRNLDRTDFSAANLMKAMFTGCSLRQANFENAWLVDAGLANVCMYRANLRGARLSGAKFHMGSSRSGLVGSPIACEGSKTGFYTDDYYDREMVDPVEIRKADLRRADLTGAHVDQCDFYLVDLRGAIYDAEQEKHFRRCGAIL